MNEEIKRWDCTDTFIATCKAITAIHEANIELDMPHRAIMTIEDVNTLQDLLKEQGFAIQKIDHEKQTNT